MLAVHGRSDIRDIATALIGVIMTITTTKSSCAMRREYSSGGAGTAVVAAVSRSFVRPRMFKTCEQRPCEAISCLNLKLFRRPTQLH